MKFLFFTLLISSSAFSFEFKSPKSQVKLIELYSTQSCSSCPPAQNRVNKLKANSNVFKDFIPVVFHVDYWDYLGWKDPYSSKKHTSRQRNYVSRWRGDTMYTPMFVMNGKEHRGRMNLTLGASMPGELKAKLEGDRIKIDLSKIKAKVSKVHVAYLGHGIKTKVKAGENSGKNLPQEFLVLEHKTYKPKQSELFIKKIMPQSASEKLSFVVWLEDIRGDYLQATGGYIN